MSIASSSSSLCFSGWVRRYIYHFRLNIVGIIGIAFLQAGQHTLQCITKGVTKVPIEVGIDEGIESGIEVANPEENQHQHIGTGTGGATE